MMSPRALAFAALLAPVALPGADPLALLETHCVSCHGGEKTKAGLDLTTRPNLLRGGESGAAVVPGQPDESLFYKMVAHIADPGMPHKEDKLPDSTIAAFRDWIRDGAPYSRPLAKTSAPPAKPEFAISATDRAHWAFQPVQRPPPPAVRDTSWSKNNIDRFILARLDAAGLAPSAPARPEVLIRRLSYDLTGLPPTPEEIDAFTAASAREPEAALVQLVDRLLASPHYGERWGRHWLDLARFAESDGFEHDAVRPHAWRYRDYVVRAFNADKPYDQFIREQVAGDELYPDSPDALIATAFNLLGPDMVDSADQVQRRRNTLNDMTDITALAFLGLTLGCARCHDHKFEPISQRDYYSLQAFFSSAKFRPDQPVPSSAEQQRYDAELARYNEQTAHLQREIASLEAPPRETIFARKLAKLSPEAQSAHKTPAAQRTTEHENLVLETSHLVQINTKELIGAMKKPERDRHAQLLEELKPFPKPKPLPASLALQNGPDVKTHILHRGDYNQPTVEVAPAFPEVLAAPAPASHRRTALAQWLTSPEHPLTARVFVNRLWQYHFGRALVGTPSDFGTHGQKPSHPELLDWLASEFVAGGWSIKRMHRLMLLSATYRQTSAADETRRTADPENRLYARMHRLRLEGEPIRDSLLFISGELNLKAGGPGVFPPIPKELFEGAKGWNVTADTREHHRRSLYIFTRRNLRFPFLEVFDAPDNNLSCPSRERSTTAPQSLTLLNADEVLRAAELTAARIEKEHTNADERVTIAYRQILGRPPTERERTLASAFLVASPLRELCRALFNLNDFLYLN